jgi:quercetin 2,3-dioxygenase
MRVSNDDIIAPGRGFGAHPHSDMEIVSIVLSGHLRHEDNMGNVAVTTFGGIQRMSAGSGVIHTEHNASDTEEVNLLQLWFMPSERGKQPSYEATEFDPAKISGQLLPIVAPTRSEGVCEIGQDLTIYLSKLVSGQQLTFKQAEGRRVFLFVIEGELAIEDTVLGKRDTARIEELSELQLSASEEAFFMLIDLP